jgi:cob(I)alamin adenosyltransferase
MIMKIYTRTGDDGTTSLAGGKRISKYHIRVEAYGTIDELISWIGLLRDHKENLARREFLMYIQEQLMLCAAAIASDPVNKTIRKFSPDPDSVQNLEAEIDKMELQLKPLENFILPGGNIIISYCHIARCVCRRAERAVLRLNQTGKTSQTINKFLNRLADYLFVLSRKICLELDIEEVKWSI